MAELIAAAGGDPGKCTGLLIAVWEPGQRTAVIAHAYQCDMASAPWLLDTLLAYDLDLPADARWVSGVEEFRVSRRAGTLPQDQSGAVRQLAGDLISVLLDHKVRAALRPAAMVKPWATDKRLEAAGLLEITAKMGDARDAARHALYAACHDGGLPDPLSRMTKRPRSPGTGPP